MVIAATLIRRLPLSSSSMLYLMGGILAPTDPVLASQVQIDDPYQLGALRFGLTSEAGLNDGSAFPFRPAWTDAAA
jgi:NhaP-type Na+/H+ or K+/H+ antiporter